jgi:prepilin-type processing-associated H-X9-DG protein
MSSRSCATKYVYQDSSFIRQGDGLSTTLLLSESLGDDLQWQSCDYEWRAGMVFFPPEPGTFLPNVHPINAPGTSAERFDTARPASHHPRGVNAIFCDGHGRFLRQEMDYAVYCALMTPHGSQAVEPGTTAASPSVREQPKLTPDSY